MRAVFALLLVGCACGRGLSVHVQTDAGAPADSGQADAGACDVIRQDCASPTEACYPRPIGAPVCASAGSRGEGAPCSLSSDCFAGFDCTGGGQSVCHRICPLGASTNRCAEGQACAPLDTFGICTPAGSYSACVYSGGLDHLTVRHSEPARNLCTVIWLASPGNNTLAELSLPPNWEVQAASISRRDGGCPLDFTAISGVLAQKLSGRIGLFVPDGGLLPTRVEAFLNVYPTPVAGIPQQVDFIASDVVLGSCF